MEKKIQIDYTRTKVQLSRPVLHDGKELNEVSFDWGSLTGKDMLEIERKMNAAGKTMGSARNAPAISIWIKAFLNVCRLAIIIMCGTAQRIFYSIRSSKTRLWKMVPKTMPDLVRA